ncbi:MAG TPA: carboxypeptidase-like regulatory domain-containing protein [Planctomycetota bacterium]|nr:carboxypeptidase-like regulatory domain-containing protein [Planctomycetota bacterium]
MRATILSALLICLSLASARAAQPAPDDGPAPAPVDTAALIEKLKSENFDERSAAYDKLAAQGETVRAQLEQAAASTDLDTRNAAWRLLGLLGKPGLRFLTYDRNGKPVEGAEAGVQMWDMSDRYQQERQNVVLKFDAKGTAELKDLKPASYNLYLTWQKCWLNDQNYMSNGYSYSNMAVTVRAGMMPFLYSVTKGGSVKGSVRDKDGKPAKDCDVSLYYLSNFNIDMLEIKNDNQNQTPMRPASSGQADALGNVTIDNVPDGVYVCVATAMGNSPVEGPTVRVREGQTSEFAPITVVANPNGKCVIALRGAPENTSKMIGPMPEPPLLKSVKLFVDEDYLFDGPDAEKKFRKVQRERANWNRYRRPPQLETDENGKLTLDSLRPGKHRIRIKGDEYAATTLTVDVPSGGTVEVNDVILNAGGSVSGKVSCGDGKPVHDLMVYPFLENETSVAELPPEIVGFIKGQYQWDDVRNYMNWQQQFANQREAPSADKLKVKNLQPGRYALLVTRQSVSRVQQVYLICGVNVEEGKTTEVPALKFAAPIVASRTINGSDNAQMRGKIVGPSSETVQRANVMYQTNQGSTSTNCSSDGTFHIYYSGMGPGGTIHVKAAGYKQADFDCSAPNVDLNNIEIKLERLSYGELRVKVVDEDGAPLRGVIVDPSPYQNANYNYYYMRRMGNAKKPTNSSGEVRFSGLSAGLRRITAMKDGYYLTDPVRVSIVANAEATLLITMRRGLTISGKLSAPEGASLNPAVVYVHRYKDNMIFSALANPTGEFSISGLSPDSYSLWAETPLLMQREAIVELNGVSESKTDLKIELVRKGGMLAKLDPEFKGRMVYLYEKERDPKKNAKPGMTNGNYRCTAYVDADGFAEFWNVKPGTYRVWLSATPAVGRATINGVTAANPDDKDGEKYASRVECSLYSAEFEVKEPKSPAELKPADAVKIAFPKADASATVKFVFRSNSEARNQYSQTTQYVMIRSDNCNGSFTRSQRYRAASQGGGIATSRLQVLGTLPSYLAPTTVSTQTLIRGLAPGKYKLTTYMWTYDNMRGVQENTEEVDVAEFEVAAGERKALGVIVIEPPTNARVQNSTNIRRTGNNTENEPLSDEDLDPAFEP